MRAGRMGSTWRRAALLLAVVCAGCASEIESTQGKDGGTSARLAIQKPALSPQNGGQLIQPEAMQEGDIILSAANSITSTGIRVLTLAPVSHAAIYVGNGRIAEAVGHGVGIRTVDQVLKEESVVVVFRHPRLAPEQAKGVREFALSHVGKRYNTLGVVLQAPFSLEKRVCDVPLLPGVLRDFCARGIATIQLGARSNDRFFCSQFVIEAYRQAGAPLADADPRWISPADIMHMREGDVPSLKVTQPLQYVGHLKYQEAPPEVASR